MSMPGSPKGLPMPIFRTFARRSAASRQPWVSSCSAWQLREAPQDGASIPYCLVILTWRVGSLVYCVLLGILCSVEQQHFPPGG